MHKYYAAIDIKIIIHSINAALFVMFRCCLSILKLVGSIDHFAFFGVCNEKSQEFSTVFHVLILQDPCRVLHKDQN